MVIPLHDDNPAASRPLVTGGLMIACTVVYVVQHLLLPRDYANDFSYAFGVTPALLTGAHPFDAGSLRTMSTVFTSMFVHSGFWHLAGNLLYLWIFGNNVEDAMGHAKFGAFYLRCGVAAVAGQVLTTPASDIPMVGASGAISGVLGAYLLLYPRAKVLLGLPLGFINLEFGRWPAGWVLVTWFTMQLVMGISSMTSSAPGGIAIGAHVGGFVAGCLLVTLFKRRGVPLWRRY